MGGRTVQKYVEFPLLTSITTANSFFLTKFDIRIWVLVISFQPLIVYIYPILYGRRCSTAYTTSLASLSDNFIHLTNYSIQKTQTFTNKNISLSDDLSGPDTLPDAKVTKKLRNIVHNYRINKDKNRIITETINNNASTNSSATNTNSTTTSSIKQEKGKFTETDLLMGEY